MSSVELSLSERDLVEQCQAKDPAAWGELFRRCQPALAAVLAKAFGDQAAVDDAVQDVMVELWEHGHALGAFGPGRGTLTVFLWTLASHRLQ
jgi:DNA-directed RNA polymerase specialized sigma24 family protein